MTALRTMWHIALAAATAFIATTGVHGQTVNVSTAAQLQSAVAAANGAGGNRTILVADGVYTLTDTLYVNAPNVTISGASGDRTKVVIQGDAMSATANVGNLIRVAASGFKLRDLTLQRSRYHLIQIVGEENADAPEIRNCVLRDAYEQMVKVSVDPANPANTSDNGIVENCVFEYTAGVGPQYYIGGIDAHGSKNWRVSGNTFRSIASPNASVAEFAVHFWNGSANNTVEGNTIINCDRGVGFGLDGRGNTGGVIRNNMIYHASNVGTAADVGIALVDSPDTRVYNNTIVLKHAFPWAIEYRFSATKNVTIVNNLTNKPIQSRDGATGTVAANVTTATDSWFVDVGAGNLRLASAVAAVVDKGQAVSGLSTDIDGQTRPQGGGIDIGADEYLAGSGSIPNPPTGLEVR